MPEAKFFTHESTTLEKAMQYAKRLRGYEETGYSPNEHMILALAKEVERLQKLVPVNARKPRGA